jgi:hypothetical protein
MNRCNKYLSDDATPTRPARRLPVQDGGDVRWDVIRRVRAAIARGEYETDERWRLTVDELLKALER